MHGPATRQSPASDRVRRCHWLCLRLVLSLLLAACASPDNASTTSSELPEQQNVYPTLADLWAADAHFVVDVLDTGLPMGESDAVMMEDGRIRSYIHASAQSAGVVDQCGDPVEFPGCVVLYESNDDGRSFAPAEMPQTCLIPCRSCPCDSRIDQIDQQQYPQVARTADGQWLMVYEYRANTFLRRSVDGLTWERPEEVPMTGIWSNWLMPCRPEEQIGEHPHAAAQFDCLVGSPPGITLVNTAQGDEEIYIFVGLGQNPGSMGCYRGAPGNPAALLRKCDNNPLFSGAGDYGPSDILGEQANSHFDFRTISSAEVLAINDRFYMLYEGVRGPGPGDAGDTQFGVGMARSQTAQIDWSWDIFSSNPILVDLPGNVGLGHTDLIVLDGQTMLFTSLDGEKRSRLVLEWK